MTDLLPFVVVGITTGSVYGLAAMGLVLTYKTSGIFNFAHGALAAVAAFAFYELHTVRGLPLPLALFLAVAVVPPVLALVMERITVALADGTATTKIVGTIGIQLAIVSALVAHYGPVGLEFPVFLPTGVFELAGINVGVDQAITIGVAAAGAIGFFVFFRLSSLGVRMRAVVDNPDLLGLAGTSAFAVRGWAWLLGTWFAAISGILLAPLMGLNAFLLTLLVVQAYGAAALGWFSSLPLTYAGGLVVGVLAAVISPLVSGSPTLSALPPAIPFLVLFAVLLVAPRRKLVETSGHRTAPAPAPLLSPGGTRVASVVAIGIAAAVPFVVGTKLPGYAAALVFVPIFYSLYLLVRMSGQISLAHAGLVAVGSAAFAHLSVGAGLPWLGAVLLAGVVAVPVGAIVAIPAIRLAGVFLALATYGFGLLLEMVFYRTDVMFGTNGSRPVNRPELFAGDVAFYYVLLAFVVGCALVVAVIGRSRLGRLLAAMADSPTTLSTLGLGVNVTRVTVFSISAFMAGVAGALYASQGMSATGVPFTSFASLTWLALLVMNSGLRLAAPVAAAVALAAIPAYITSATLITWLPVLFGVGAVLVAIQEAKESRRRSGVSDTVPEHHGGSRAAERIGAGGPGSERLAAAASTARRRGSGTGPARVRIGSAQGGSR